MTLQNKRIEKLKNLDVDQFVQSIRSPARLNDLSLIGQKTVKVFSDWQPGRQKASSPPSAIKLIQRRREGLQDQIAALTEQIKMKKRQIKKQKNENKAMVAESEKQREMAIRLKTMLEDAR